MNPMTFDSVFFISNGNEKIGMGGNSYLFWKNGAQKNKSFCYKKNVIIFVSKTGLF
jgi:hypothetical protein